MKARVQFEAKPHNFVKLPKSFQRLANFGANSGQGFSVLRLTIRDRQFFVGWLISLGPKFQQRGNRCALPSKSTCPLQQYSGKLRLPCSGRAYSTDSIKP